MHGMLKEIWKAITDHIQHNRNKNEVTGLVYDTVTPEIIKMTIGK